MSDSLSSQLAAASLSADVAQSSASSSTSSRAHLPPLRVLTLGDGNFSFSAAIVQMHEGKRQRSKKTKVPGPNEAGTDASCAPAAASAAPSATSSAPSFHPTHRLHLVATSFDSSGDLRAKYPEAAKLCDKIAGGKKAKINRVEHDVDATQLERTLRGKLEQQPPSESPAALADSSIPTFAAATPLSPDHRFDVIIFNHPHSGREDLALHGSLLAHFFHSAKGFLREDDAVTHADGKRQRAQIHVTLCMKQPEDWELLKHAASEGFRLLSRSQFLESHYPSYETKRHHVNKTFARKTIERMELFIFERQEDMEGGLSEVPPPVYTQTAQDPSFAHNLLSHVIPLPAFHPTLPLDELAKDSATKDVAKPILLTEWRCASCEKGFTSERGLRYHMIDVHQTQDQGASAATSFSSPEADLVCTQCDPPREFKNAEAMHQHVLARHTAPMNATAPALALAAASSAASETSTTGESSTYGASLAFPCPICPMSFASSAALDLHLAGGVPPIAAASVECLECGRVFSNQRALDQHARAMLVSPEKHVRIDLSQVEGETNAILGGATGKMKKLREMVATRQGQEQLPTSAVERLGAKMAVAAGSVASTPASTA